MKLQLQILLGKSNNLQLKINQTLNNLQRLIYCSRVITRAWHTHTHAHARTHTCTCARTHAHNVMSILLYSYLSNCRPIRDTRVCAACSICSVEILEPSESQITGGFKGIIYKSLEIDNFGTSSRRYWLLAKGNWSSWPYLYGGQHCHVLLNIEKDRVNQQLSAQRRNKVKCHGARGDKHGQMRESAIHNSFYVGIACRRERATSSTGAKT